MKLNRSLFNMSALALAGSLFAGSAVAHELEITDWQIDENVSTEECEVLAVTSASLPDEDESDDKILAAIDFELDFETELNSPDRIHRSRCAWKVDVRAPEGFRVRIGRMDIGGNASVEHAGSKAVVTASYRVLGDASPVARRTFLQNKNGEAQPFEITSPFDQDSPWSDCGGSFAIKGRTDVKLKTNKDSHVMDSVVIQNAAGKHYYRYVAELTKTNCGYSADSFASFY